MSLGFFQIKDMGAYISEVLHKNGVNDKDNNLVIYVNKEDLQKIDEDLYYRTNPQGTEFKPSDNEIEVNFINLKIQIRAKQE